MRCCHHGMVVPEIFYFALQYTIMQTNFYCSTQIYYILKSNRKSKRYLRTSATHHEHNRSGVAKQLNFLCRIHQFLFCELSPKVMTIKHFMTNNREITEEIEKHSMTYLVILSKFLTTLFRIGCHPGMRSMIVHVYWYQLRTSMLLLFTNSTCTPVPPSTQKLKTSKK
jgi:hypothetical protein